jgi:hypothetical protein
MGSLWKKSSSHQMAVEKEASKGGICLKSFICSFKYSSNNI